MAWPAWLRWGMLALVASHATDGVTAPAVIATEYRLAARADPAIAAGVVTEIWARVYRPAQQGSGPAPLLVFLHGNHGTCGRLNPELGIREDYDVTYTFEGRCPSGLVVAPSHAGYGYLAEDLAGRGYIVVSINANRGVNAADGVRDDQDLTARRGRLILKHLELLSGWSRNGGAPPSLGFDLRGRLDLTQIGLLGHSRGGEGARLALAQLRAKGSPWPGRIGAGAQIRAIFEIAPTAGGEEAVPTALGVAWNVLLPYCDGDVASLEGVQVFDRMLRALREPARLPKSTFAVWGANHNFYNTEWQESDSEGCVGHQPLFPPYKGSPRQRQTASASVVPFFLAHVGRKATGLAPVLNPDLPLPPALIALTRIDRGYTDTPDKAVEARVETFDRPTGVNSSGQRNAARGIAIEHVQPRDHAPFQRSAALSWAKGGGYLELNWAPPGAGRNISAYETLEFRVTRQCNDPCDAPAAANAGQAVTDFTLQLIRPDGSLSSTVPLSSVLSLRGPVGGEIWGGANLHPLLTTARVPLAAFGAAASVRGLRFTFDRTPSGAINLADVRLSKRNAGQASGSARVAEAQAAPPEESAVSRPRAPAAAASVAGVRRAKGAIEVEIALTRPLPVGDAAPVLQIGGERFRLSRLPRTGRTDRLIFSLDPAGFTALKDGAPAELRLGARRPLPLGGFEKAQLR